MIRRWVIVVLGGGLVYTLAVTALGVTAPIEVIGAVILGSILGLRRYWR